MENITLHTQVSVDKYTEYVCDKFDLQTRNEITTVIPTIDKSELGSFDWNIGLICGNSGSGKSTVLNTLGEIRIPTYDLSKSVISQFQGLNEEESSELLLGVGLCSIPVWLHKPNELSNGEYARLDICKLIADSKEGETILIDEFTSVVNRPCAKSMSHSLQRYAREKGLKIILSSCHYDIIEWLRPDWIFNLNKLDNGNVELERIVYKDDDSYSAYQNIKSKEKLTEVYDV